MKRDREADANRLRDRLGIDPRAAREALLLIAECLDAGEPIPQPFASDIAAIIRLAMDQRSAERGAALAIELGLTAPAKTGRTATVFEFAKLRRTIEGAIADNNTMTETQLHKRVAKAFGVSPNTAAKHVPPSASVMPRIMHRNGLRSLVLPRSPCRSSTD